MCFFPRKRQKFGTIVPKKPWVVASCFTNRFDTWKCGAVAPARLKPGVFVVLIGEGVSFHSDTVDGSEIRRITS